LLVGLDEGYRDGPLGEPVVGRTLGETETVGFLVGCSEDSGTVVALEVGRIVGGLVFTAEIPEELRGIIVGRKVGA
jgi:hypothetical protein